MQETQTTVYVLTVAHEDRYHVDPERPRVFASMEAVSAYMGKRGFTAIGEAHWCQWDRNGAETNAHAQKTTVRG